MGTEENNRFPLPLIYTEYKTEDDVTFQILLKDFIWNDPVYGEIKVPKGFIFDGASLPAWSWGALKLHPLSKDVIRGGIIHDYLYRTHLLDREDADLMLKRILKYEGNLSNLKISLIYYAVKTAGNSSYNSKKEESEYLRPDLVDNFLNK